MARTLGKNSVDATGSSARQAFERFGPYVTISLLLIAWELASRLGLVIPFLLPPLSVVITRIATDFMSGQLPLDIAITLYRTLTAFALSVIVGVTIGIVISRNATMRWFFDPLISIGLPMPKIALLPVFMLWFGLFDLSKILMVAFSASFQIIIATWSATQSIEKELIWSARSLGASRRDILREVILPAAMPQILTGLQIAMPICLIVVLITEMIMGGQGPWRFNATQCALCRFTGRLRGHRRNRDCRILRHQGDGVHPSSAADLASGNAGRNDGLKLFVTVLAEPVGDQRRNRRHCSIGI
jgi:ABC-type nitrate/sulfonate/bicarbonate transport system permease component